MKIDIRPEAKEAIQLIRTISELQDLIDPEFDVDFTEDQDTISELGFNQVNPFSTELIKLTNHVNSQISQPIDLNSGDMSYLNTLLHSYKGSELVVDLIAMHTDIEIPYTKLGSTTPTSGWHRESSSVLTVNIDRVINSDPENVVQYLKNTLDSLLWYSELHVRIKDKSTKIFITNKTNIANPIVDNCSNQFLDLI